VDKQNKTQRVPFTVLLLFITRSNSQPRFLFYSFTSFF